MAPTNEGGQVSEAHGGVTTTPTWTIMLYLSGDNNLSTEMVRALKDIDDQGVPDGVDMTILYDALSRCCPTFLYDLSGRRGTPTRAHRIERPEAAPIPLSQGNVYAWGEDSSSPEALREFIDWSLAGPQAQYRMVILSGHGSGALGDFLPDNNASGGQAGSLTIPALRTALEDEQVALQRAHLLQAEEKLVHVLGMDSCLMSMAEVCNEIHDSVRYVVGSEGFIPNAGWPYGHLLKMLRQRNVRTLTPQALTGHLVEDFLAYYRDYLPADVSVDIAGCDLDLLGGLTEAVRQLVDVLDARDRQVQNLVLLAHWRAQSYKFEQYTDLWDFCHQLRTEAEASRMRLEWVAGASEPPKTCESRDRLEQLGAERQTLERIEHACQRVETAINAMMGHRHDGKGGRQGYQGIEFQHSHGLSVYFPWSQTAFAEEYKELTFARGSGWGRFLSNYVEATRRRCRCEEEGDVHPELRWPAESQIAAMMPSLASAPTGTRNAPNVSKNAPNVSKNAPNVSKNAPLVSKLLGVVGETLPWSMKNPPRSVCLSDGHGVKRPPAAYTGAAVKP